jgi:hypothetical protein
MKLRISKKRWFYLFFYRELDGQRKRRSRRFSFTLAAATTALGVAGCLYTYFRQKESALPVVAFFTIFYALLTLTAGIRFFTTPVVVARSPVNARALAMMNMLLDRARVGLEFRPRDRKSDALIARVTSGSPADTLYVIRDGDVLLKVDGLDVAERFAARKIRWSADTKLRFELQRTTEETYCAAVALISHTGNQPLIN